MQQSSGSMLANVIYGILHSSVFRETSTKKSKRLILTSPAQRNCIASLQDQFGRFGSVATELSPFGANIYQANPDIGNCVEKRNPKNQESSEPHVGMTITVRQKFTVDVFQ